MYALRAYFIYNILSVAVEIPSDQSGYHTFDDYHNHQTSVPFVKTDNHIYFNQDDTYIFAWGNGKSDCVSGWMRKGLFVIVEQQTF